MERFSVFIIGHIVNVISASYTRLYSHFLHVRDVCLMQGLKSLNTIYLTLITQKAQRTYKCILEGADVGVLWSYVVEETGEPGENHRPWTGDHYPATLTP